MDDVKGCHPCFLSLLNLIDMFNNDELYQLQVDYCKNHSLPLFCYKNTGKGTPIGEYFVKQLGYDKAVVKLSTELITGCPETGRTWCD